MLDFSNPCVAVSRACSRNLRALPLIVVAAAALSACASLQSPAKRPPANVASAPPLSKQAQIHYHILAGELALQRGRNTVAAQQYLAALRLWPTPQLAQRTVNIALYTNDMALEREATQRWVTIAPKSLDAWKTSARVDLENGHRTAALNDAEKVLSLDPDGPGAGMRQIALLFSDESDHADDAMAIMDKLVQRHARLASAYYAKGLLAMNYERLDTARKCAEKALSLKPSFLQASLLEAGVEIKSGHMKRADRIMNRVFARAPRNADLRIAYARLLLDANQAQAAARQFHHVLSFDPRNPDALYATGLLELNDNKDARARHFFLRLLHTGQRNNEASYYLGRIDEDQGHYRGALHWYQQVSGGPQALDAVLRRARMQARLGHLKQARQFLENLRERNPQLAPQLYQEEGDLLYNAGRYEQAAHVYGEAVEAFPQNDELRYAYAMALEDQGQHEQARHELRRIIKHDPQNAQALNALGYLMTNQTNDYAEAKGYIQRALKITPDDPATMDSMGWVEHHLGYNKKALTYLRRAYEQMPESEIAAHLGAVLWVLGQHNKARHVWNKALHKHPHSPILKSTIQKYTQ